MAARSGVFNQWVQRRAEKRAEELAIPLLPWLRLERGPLLDFGCGLGHIGLLASQSTHRPVTYLDVRDYPFTPPGVDITVFDGVTIPFPAGFFATSLVALVLHHTPDPPASLREVLRVTSTSLVVCEDAIASRKDFYVESFKDTVTNCFLPHMRFQYHTVAEWESLFAAAGLQVQHKVHFKSHYIFDFQHVAWYLVKRQ
jgi:SAM-dependent methyltransferase